MSDAVASVLGSATVNTSGASDIPRAWPWRGAWPAEPLGPQPAVEGSYAGWLGPHPSAQTCAEQHKRPL